MKADTPPPPGRQGRPKSHPRPPSSRACWTASRLTTSRLTSPLPLPPPLQAVKAAIPSKSSSAPKQQSLLDSKRAHNISILLGSKIKWPLDRLHAALVVMEPKLLDGEETIAALLQVRP